MLASRMDVTTLYLSSVVLTMNPIEMGIRNASRPRTAAFLRLRLKSLMLISRPARNMM